MRLNLWRAALPAALATIAVSAGILTQGSQAQDAKRGIASELESLRIEGPKKNILPETWYVTGDESIKRSRGLKCKHTNGREEVLGSTALGITETASRDSDELPSVRVREDDFGLFVCELGGLTGRPFDDPDGFSGWTYWINDAGGTQAAENESLTDGDRVLWVFADFGDANLNTGDALELEGVPANDADGAFTVSVTAYGFAGSPTPVAGMKIKGAETVSDNADGTYDVTVGNGFTSLYAKGKPAIASPAVEVCVRANPAQCPEAHGRVIVGSSENDLIDGTAGWDEIRSGGGPDVVNIAPDSGRDKVNCGGGEDEVIVLEGDTDDEIAANCEEIIEAA